MAYKIPWSNFHELNLDWLLEQVKKLREDVDNITGSATPYTSTPEMDGVGSPGTEVAYARGDHRHPTDTSRAAAADLSQEILDRGAADDTLQANIDATDAKIKFSSSAPYMDSSSASAGFSDYMARADHVHPTDTSRASATDVATLQARMDAFSGSAAPSDTTPLMDGVGAAGTGGNYSRGDHVHPSDTSKLDKSGGSMTGDLHMTGSAIVKQDARERHIHTTSIGWLRVATVPQVDGTKCRINIVRKGDTTPSETHSIDLVINQGSVSFSNEHSVADVLYIDKIRYTSAGKVDIHMDQSYGSDIGIFMDAYAPTATLLEAVELIPITGVAEAPAGETIVLTYGLHTNDVEDIAASITIDSAWTLMTKQATIDHTTGVVDIMIEVNSGVYSAGSQYTIATIDVNYAPHVSTYVTGHTTDISYTPTGLLTVLAHDTGAIKVVAENTTGSYFFIHLSYHI